MAIRLPIERNAAGAGGPPFSARARLGYHGLRIALLVSLAVVTYLLFPNAPAVDSPIFEVGSVATENVIAPFEFVVPKSPPALAEERNELAQSVKPILEYRQPALDSAQTDVRAFMDTLSRTVERGAAAHATNGAQRT
ncbi:MAG: hypothetical protein ACREND_03415 [Gemmatimonadaceae bacterium]